MKTLVLWLAVFAAVSGINVAALPQTTPPGGGQPVDEITQTIKACGRPKRDYKFPADQSVDGKLTRYLMYQHVRLWFIERAQGWIFEGVSQHDDGPVELDRAAAVRLLPCFAKVRAIPTPTTSDTHGEETPVSVYDKSPVGWTTAILVGVLVLGAVGLSIWMLASVERNKGASEGPDRFIAPADPERPAYTQVKPSKTVDGDFSPRRSVQSSEVQIYSGGVDQQYTPLGMIEAKRSKRTALSADPTLDEVNAELRQKAAAMGANAVLDVDYKREISLISYGVLTARGEAVILESDTKTCPQCAETIKRAAVKCRFCGADLQHG